MTTKTTAKDTLLEPRRIALIQMHSVPGDTAANLVHMEALAQRALERGAEIVCFPEGSATGYRTQDADAIALPEDDRALRMFEHHMTGQGVSVGYGFIERHEHGLSVAYAVADGTERMIYRKSHLGRREQDVFVAGDALCVARIAGIAIGVQLCWESHIPDISTTLRARGAELLLVPFASPATGTRRREIWERYLPARAYDNGCFVAACNALTYDGLGLARGGGLCAYDPKGEVIAHYYGGDEHMICCNLQGPLPRECAEQDMQSISFFDRRRPELYC